MREDRKSAAGMREEGSPFPPPSQGAALIDLSHHARVRMQQRAVPGFVVDALLVHGAIRHVGEGNLAYSFTKRGWARMRAACPDLARRLERWRNVYIVVTAEGVVRTVVRRKDRPHHAGAHRPRPDAGPLPRL